MANPRKTTRQRTLEGNPGKRSLAPKPQALPGRPVMPAGLSEVAQQEWHRVCDLLDADARLKAQDAGFIARHCKLYGYIIDCEAILDQEGHLVPGDRGMVKNPACQIHRQYSQIWQKSCELLGVDARRRDVAPEHVDDDPEGLLD